jgi:cell division septal protein FtsQ
MSEYMPKSGKEFLRDLAISLATFIVFILAMMFITDILSTSEKPIEKTPAKGNVDSEYQDAMDSKNYDPNSEGGEQCWGTICN